MRQYIAILICDIIITELGSICSCYWI